MLITKEQVMKALDSLESQLGEPEAVVKSSDTDIDEPEGADLGNPAKEKLSSMAPKGGKTKKSEKPAAPAEEEDEEEEEGEKEKGEKKNPFAKKSFAEDLPEEIQTKIDVSEFLKSLVDHTGESIDELRSHLVKSDVETEARYGSLAESVVDLAKSQAKIGIVLKAICERIGVIENAPARAPKAETVAKSEGDKPAERKFSSGLEQNDERVFKSLSDNPIVAKSQIATALCDLVRKGEATDLDVIGFESSGHIAPELVGKLKTALN